MNVRLIAITKPAIPDCADAGDLLAFCARVSNPANQANSETAPRLLAYLVRNQHWEFSQRYAAVVAPPVIREARLQDTKNRQASNETDDAQLQEWWENEQRCIGRHSASIYEQALKRGIAKEVARSVLPEGMTESVIYMAGTIRSWIHYCQLRTAPGTQKEHREVALACCGVLLEQFPALAEVLS